MDSNFFLWWVQENVVPLTIIGLPRWYTAFSWHVVGAHATFGDRRGVAPFPAPVQAHILIVAAAMATKHPYHAFACVGGGLALGASLADRPSTAGDCGTYLFFDWAWDFGSWWVATRGYNMGGRCGLAHKVIGNHRVVDFGALEYNPNLLYGWGRGRAHLVGEYFGTTLGCREGVDGVSNSKPYSSLLDLKEPEISLHGLPLLGAGGSFLQRSTFGRKCV